ncbi:MAG: hypothetical protein V8R91_20900 [Butyricimonas faecihominis]
MYLNRYPCWVIPEYRLVNLVVDGTYFSNKICLFIYRENELKETYFTGQQVASVPMKSTKI